MAVNFAGAPAPAPEKKKFGPGQGTGGKAKLPNGLTWADVEKEYVEHNIEHPEAPLTHAMIAEKYGVTFSSVNSASKRHSWGQKVTEGRMLKRGFEQAAFAGMVVNEAEVRKRQAEMAQTIAMRAYQRLLEIDPSELGPKEARMLLQLGLEQNRKALGLPDTFVFIPGGQQQQTSTVQDAINENDKVKRLGAAFLTFVKAKGGGQVVDVESKDVSGGSGGN